MHQYFSRLAALKGFPCGSAGKESACNAGDLGLIPELGRSPGEGKGYPLQYSGLENFMDCIVHGVSKSQTWLSCPKIAIHYIFIRDKFTWDQSSIPVSGRSPGKRNCNLLQYSCLEHPMDGGAWWVIVHGISQGWTWLKLCSTHYIFTYTNFLLL